MLEGASCSAPIQLRVRLPTGGEAQLPSGLVSRLLLLKNALQRSDNKRGMY